MKHDPTTLQSESPSSSKTYVNLPVGWTHARLGEITVRSEYGTSTKCDYSGRSIPVLRIPNIARGEIDTSDLKRAIAKISLDDGDELQLGDILICRTNGSLSLLGKAAVIRCAFESSHSFASYLLRFRFLERETLPRWVHLFLSSIGRRFIESHAASSAGQHNISLSTLHTMSLPIAPINEQRRIVAKIDELFSDLDAGVAALERAQANLKRYRASVLKAAVEGKLTEEWRSEQSEIEAATELLKRTASPARPARYKSRSIDVIAGHAALSVGHTGKSLPADWAWSPLVDIAKMESGHTPSRNHPEWWDGDVKWVGILDAKAHHGGVIYETLQHTNEEGLANSAARLLPIGTVCVSRTAASIGYVIVLGNPMATSQDFVNWVPTEAVTSEWLRLVFMVDREVLVHFGKGSTHKTVYFPEWLSLHVAVPPLKEQERITGEVDLRLSQIAIAERQLETDLLRAARLRQSILKQAFEGKLVPQDPKDEPASKLLDHTRKEQVPTNGSVASKGRPRNSNAKATKAASK